MVVALRYQSLGGVGFQLALPAFAWHVLEEDFGVEVKGVMRETMENEGTPW